jgi:hypothetical protein
MTFTEQDPISVILPEPDFVDIDTAEYGEQNLSHRKRRPYV